MCVRTHWLGIFGQYACYRWHSNALNCGYFVWVDAHTIGCNRSPILLPSLCIYCLWLNGMWKSSLFFSFSVSFYYYMHRMRTKIGTARESIGVNGWVCCTCMHVPSHCMYACARACLFKYVCARHNQISRHTVFMGLQLLKGALKLAVRILLCNGKYETDLISIDSITNSIMSHEKWKKQWQYSKMQQISMCVILFF